MSKQVHFMYVPWTGLGLFGGFRGNRWLKNRIKVFKQFVVPSLEAQTNKNFILWCSWRPQEMMNKHVIELQNWLETETELKVVNTWSGVCFWDDKYPDDIARERLISAVHGSMGYLLNYMGEATEVLMTIQPSDDCYHKEAVQEIQYMLGAKNIQAFGYKKGYMMNYRTLEVAAYNPKTNPPFFTIKFPREIFTDPRKHLEYTGPYKSHEYIGEKLVYKVNEDRRGFLVGTHGENISTVFDHPYKGMPMPQSVLKDFGLENAEPIQIRQTLRRAILRRLPYARQRRIRYVVGERFWQKIYEFLRS